MSKFEVLVLVALFAIAGGIAFIAGALIDVRRELIEIWKRMKRLD